MNFKNFYFFSLYFFHQLKIEFLLLIDTKNNLVDFFEKLMAGEQGFEPQFYGPEPYVLPLDDSPLQLLFCEYIYG